MGAEVVLYHREREDREKIAREIAAQRGAVLCYAEGYKASAAGEEVNTRLHHLVAQGYLYFKQQRCVREGVRVGFQYLIERSSRPWGQPLKVVR